MLQALKNLFTPPAEQRETISYHRAVAALLMEVMLADHKITVEEEKQVKLLLNEVTDLGEDIDVLFEQAIQGVEDANDLYQFTKVINAQASLDEKINLLKGLWLVALADGDLDAYEDHRIRRISELLFLSHSEFIQSKLAAQAE